MPYIGTGRDSQGNEVDVYASTNIAERMIDENNIAMKNMAPVAARDAENVGAAAALSLFFIVNVIFKGSISQRIGLALGAWLAYSNYARSLAEGSSSTAAIVVGVIIFLIGGSILAFIGGLIGKLFGWVGGMFNKE